MSQKAKKFISSRMEIIDHFDEVINELDIYTEVLLDEMEKRGGDKQTYTPQYFNKENTGIDIFLRKLKADQYISDYEYERVEDVPKSMANKDYVNFIRAKSIVELKKARDGVLAEYDANASRLKRDWSKMENVEERERLREDLFGKQFCFSIQINAPEREYHHLVRMESQKVLPKTIFKFCIIFVDFYLNEMEIVKLRKLVNHVNGEFEEETKLNEKTLLMNQIDKYVWGRLDFANFGNEVIRIQKAQLLSIEKFNIKANCDESNHSFYVSRVKSLGLKGGHFFDLSVFPNLRHLYWTKDNDEQNDVSEVKFQCTNFNTLQTLKINLRHNFSELNNILNNLLNLENLDISLFNFPSEKLQLNQLLNLKHLILCCSNSTNFPLSLNNFKNLELLSLTSCNLDDDCFDGLSNLRLLFIHSVEKLPFQNFKCLKKLSHLTIIDCYVPALELNIQNLVLPSLKNLFLCTNKIELLNEGNFSGLKSLRLLVLNNNRLRKLDKNVFNGLDNLEVLELSGNPLDEVETTLANLKQINAFINVRFN